MLFSSVTRCFLRLPLFLALLVLPMLLAGCLLGQQPQLISIKAGDVEQVRLRCDNSTNPAYQEMREEPFWVMITDGEGAIRAKYRVLKQGHQGGVLAQGLTPDTVSLMPAGKYVVEVTHPESGAIHSTNIRRIFMPVVGSVLSPDRVLAAFSADQNPIYRDVLQDQYTYQRGRKVVLAGSMVEQCNP